MANAINTVIKTQAQESVSLLLKNLQGVRQEIIKTSEEARKMNAGISGIKSPSGLSNNASANAQLVASMKQQSAELATLQKKYTELANSIEKVKPKQIAFMRQLEAETKARQALEAQRQKAIAVNDKEAIALEKSYNSYNKVQSKVNAMIPTYNNLATKQALGLTLSAKEEAQLTRLTGSLNKYQDILKKVDANIGKHQREVGNYAKANSNLSNSFGQITRELPNFGQSFSVGVLSLTNNIGALQDSIKQVKEQNIALKAEGKATTSLLSQIGSAVFSFNTALYLGIGILSAYSKEIAEWAENLFSAGKYMKELEENQTKFNNIRTTGRKDAQSDIIELKKYLAVVQDRNLSDEQRSIALKKLRQDYPFYFKNLTDEQILLGDTKKAQDELNTALDKRKQVEQATEINVANKQRLIDIEKELKIQEKAYQIAIKPKLNLTLGTYQTDPILVTNEKSKLDKLLADRKAYQKAIINNDAMIIKLKKETIALEYQEEKSANDNLAKAQEDRLKLIYENAKKELEIEIYKKQKIYENDELDYKVRLNALYDYLDLKGQLTTLDYNEEVRQAKGNDLKIVGADLEKKFSLIKNLEDFNDKKEKLEIESVNKLSETGIKEIKTTDLLAEAKKNASKELDDYTNKLKEQEEATKRLNEATDDFINSFSSGFLSKAGLGSLQIFLDGTFKDLLKGADTLADTLAEKFAVTFNAVSEVAQEAFSFINEASQKNYDEEYSRLEEQKNVAILYAGESTEAKKKIEDDYEKRKKEIANREAKAKKKMALFNIVVDTAQAVVSAISKYDYTSAILFGLIGAAQYATVSSQEIPRYFKGGKHKGGLAMINDGGGSNYVETVVTPDGKATQYSGRNVITDLPAGSEIFAAGVIPPSLMLPNFELKQNRDSNGNSDQKMNELISTVKNKKELHLEISQRGIITWSVEQQKRTQMMNDRFEFKQTNV